MPGCLVCLACVLFGLLLLQCHAVSGRLLAYVWDKYPLYHISSHVRAHPPHRARRQMYANARLACAAHEKEMMEATARIQVSRMSGTQTQIEPFLTVHMPKPPSQAMKAL